MDHIVEKIVETQYKKSPTRSKSNITPMLVGKYNTNITGGIIKKYQYKLIREREK